MTETRAEKAQRLVDEGRVAILSTVSWGFEAMVIGKYDDYAVTLFNNGTYECYCDWGGDHVLTTDLCAHAWAVRLTLEKEKGA